MAIKIKVEMRPDSQMQAELRIIVMVPIARGRMIVEAPTAWRGSPERPAMKAVYLINELLSWHRGKGGSGMKGQGTRNPGVEQQTAGGQKGGSRYKTQ
jgi:hypothetical protein